MFEQTTPLDEAPIAYLDVETTGLSPAHGDRVCEVAALRCEGTTVVDALQQLVNPQRPVSPGALAVHGISDATLSLAPTFDTLADDLAELLEGAVFVGHNAAFDLDFISSEFCLLRRSLPPIIALDTLRLARQTYRLPSFGLGALAAALGVDHAGRAHRAMADVLLTRGVMERIMLDLRPLGVRTVADFMAHQGGELRWGSLAPSDVPPIIREALEQHRYLYLRYRSEGGEETERLVQPLGVTQRNGEILLVAHCLLRDAQRSFRIDRIVDVEMVESFG
jgi:DNA polymerase-3 subunit epsilon